MKKTLIILTVIFSFATILPAKHVDRTKYGPWVTDVSDTGFTVLWKTSSPVLSYVIACPDDGGQFEAVERPRFYETVAGRAIAREMHSIKVTGLQPGTRYLYRIYGKRVKDDSDAYGIEYGPEMIFSAGKSRTFSVRTLDPKADSCRFSMVCDMHFNANLYSSLFKGKNGRNMDFVALCGDITSKSDNIDSVIKYSFQPIDKIVQSTAVVFARGNHESRGHDFYLVPEAFPTSTGEFYYGFRQGPVAFLVLDAGEDKPDKSPEYSGYAHFDEYRAEELDWLKRTVKEEWFARAPKKVVIMHIPTLNLRNSWYSQKWASETFAPILSAAGVDLMLSGHHHKLIVKNAGDDGIGYPVVVNSNKTRLDFEADSKKITLNIYSTEGSLLKTLEY